MDYGVSIGMKNNERKLLRIIQQLINKEELSTEDKEFLNKKGIIINI